MEASAAKHKGRTSLHIVDSILSGFIVLYATYLIQNFTENKGLLVILFLLMAAENAIRLNEGKRTKTQRFCVMAFYLVGAALILIIDPFHSSLLAAAAVELIVIVFNRVSSRLVRRGDMTPPDVLAASLDLPLMGAIPESKKVYQALLTHKTPMQCGDMRFVRAIEGIAGRLLGAEVPMERYAPSAVLQFFRRGGDGR